MSTAYPWCDSPWLTSYVRARDHVFAHYSERLDAVVASFDVLRTDPDFEVKQVRDMLSGEERDAREADVRRGL